MYGHDECGAYSKYTAQHHVLTVMELGFGSIQFNILVFCKPHPHAQPKEEPAR